MKVYEGAQNCATEGENVRRHAGAGVYEDLSLIRYGRQPEAVACDSVSRARYARQPHSRGDPSCASAFADPSDP
jgi:hypothetical protein